MKRRNQARRCIVAKRQRAGGFVWVVDFTDQTGRRRVEAVTPNTREQANAVKLQRMGEVKAGTYAPADADLATFTQVAAAFLSKCQARSTTVADYQIIIDHHLAPALLGLAMIDLTLDDCERLRDAMKAKGRKPRTINKALTILTMIFIFASKHGIPVTNHARVTERVPIATDAQRVRADRLLSRAELAGLLEAAGPHYRPLLQTLAYTGLRISEALALKWGDLALDARLILVRSAIRDGVHAAPKSDASVRDVDIPASLRAALLEHKMRSKWKRDEDYVFSATGSTVTTESRPLNSRNVYHRGLKPALKRAGILKATGLHDLRHGYASAMLAAGINIVRVAALLGHSSPAVTLKVYSHLIPAHRDDAADKLDAFFGQSCYIPVTPDLAVASADSQVIDLVVPSRGIEPRTPSLRKRDDTEPT